MVTVLVTSFILLAAISYAFYCRQRSSSREDAANHRQIPPRFRGLFDEADALDAQPASNRAAGHSTSSLTSEERARLRERAALNDKAALVDAQEAARTDTALYDELLDALVEQADSDQKLLALVSYVTRHDGLRVNKRLAVAFIESWKTNSPDRSSTAKMLHVAALSDDAALYRQAVETALQFWRDRRIPNLSAEELRMLAESEYWLLSGGVRSSGTGFILKRKLAGLRRELAAAINSIQ
jgi:hypothetical protein